MSEKEVEVVQVRMRDETLGQLDRFMTIVKSPSRSDAVRRSLGITDLISSEVIKGSRLILEKKNGKQTQILITGLNR